MTELVVIIGEEIPESLLKNWDDNCESWIEFSFPESGKHPKEHIEWVKENLERMLDHPGPVIIKTYSDFIVREINILIMEKKIDYRNIKVVDDGTVHESDVYGIEVNSLDEVIEEQNGRAEDTYYRAAYGDEKD